MPKPRCVMKIHDVAAVWCNNDVLIILDSAVETVARGLKLMKMRWIFKKFPETVFTHTVKEIF